MFQLPECEVAMFFDKLFKRNKPANNVPVNNVPANNVPIKNVPTNNINNEEFAAALAEYAVQSIKVGPVQTEAVIPSFQGDYAKAVFLWATSKKVQLKGDEEYPRYIKYELGIRRPSEYHKQMIQEGYLEQDSFESALQSLKQDELKEIASDLQVATTGKKADLAKRIAAADNNEYLRRQFPATFSLSATGKQFVEDHDDCVQIHKHKTMLIEWDEYSREKARSEDKSFYSVCTNILLKRASSDKRLFGRIDYLFLSKLADEFGDPARSLRYLLQVLYIDVSGVMGMESYMEFKKGSYMTKQSLKSYFVSHVMIAGITDRIVKNKEYFDPSIIDKLYSWKLPVMICEKELFTEMVNGIMDGSFNQQFYLAQLKLRYERFVDNL